jgi:hypothetical protein
VNSVSTSNPPESRGVWSATSRVNARYPDHDVLEARREDPIHEEGDEAVPRAVHRAIGLPPLAGLPGADDVIRAGFEDRRQEVVHAVGGIGRIPVHQDVDVGVHLLEHRHEDVPFPLPLLGDDDRAGPGRDLSRAVRAVVVEDVDRDSGKLPREVEDDLSDGRRLVEAGDEDRDRDLASARRAVRGGGDGRRRAHGGPPLENPGESTAPRSGA